MPAPAISIGSAHISDGVTLCQLNRACGSALDWTDNQISQELCTPGSFTLFAFVAKETTPVGFITVRQVGDVADLLGLGTVPQFRRCGIASLLISTIIDLINDKGVRTVTLEVRSSNIAAITCYAACGFISLATRKSYYQDGEACMVMQKKL